jgi:hypothetical protein
MAEGGTASLSKVAKRFPNGNMILVGSRKVEPSIAADGVKAAEDGDRDAEDAGDVDGVEREEK